MGVIMALAAIGSSLLAGVYASFAMIVMPALRRRSPAEATATMVEINARAERGPFIALFLAVTAVAAVLAVSALARQSAGGAIVAGAALGSSAITAAANVPLNRRLAREGRVFWPTYQARWNRWNAVRAVVAAVAPVAAVVGLRAL